MGNAAGRSPRCQKKKEKTENLSPVSPLTFALDLAASAEETSRQTLELCSAANFLSPEKNEPKNALKVKVVSAERKTKIMIALKCSWGAVCSLKSSKEEASQWRASFVFRRRARRTAAHTKQT